MSRLSFRSDAGFSLVSVIIASALLSIVGVTIAYVAGQASFLAKKVRRNSAYEDVENVFANTVAQNSRAYYSTTPPCGQALGGFFEGKPVGGQGKMYFVGTGGTGSISVPASAPASHSLASSRCANSPKSWAGVGDVYFCLTLSGGTGNNESFMNSNYAFAEVFVGLRDGRTHSAVSCSAYASTADKCVGSATVTCDPNSPTQTGNFNSSGQEIYYSLYWSQGNGKNLNFFSKDGALFAN